MGMRNPKTNALTIAIEVMGEEGGIRLLRWIGTDGGADKKDVDRYGFRMETC